MAKKTISVSVDEDVLDRLNDHLEYGDSRSEVVEEAIIEKLDRMECDKGNAKTPTTIPAK